MLFITYRPLISFMDGQYEQAEQLLPDNKQNTSTGGSCHCRFMKLQGDILLSVMDRNTFLMQKTGGIITRDDGVISVSIVAGTFSPLPGNHGMRP